jgi:hypothetical protein
LRDNEKESLYRLEKTQPKKKIKVIDLVNDIREGLSDTALANKYQLSYRGLQSALRKLVYGQFVTQAELDARPGCGADTVEIDDMRKVLRSFPALAVAIHDEKNPEKKGVVVNITEKGVGTTGILTKVDEVKSLVVQVGQYSEFDPIRFEAKCRWFKQKGANRNCTAGFEITNISEKALKELRDFIQGLTLTTLTPMP